MFWGPSPLCLACAMSGDADNCREALDAAPARWTAFQKRFKVAPDLYFVQMLLCIWRHFVRMATRRRSAGQVTWKTVARQSVESLWQQESIRFKESWTHLPVVGLQKALISAQSPLVPRRRPQSSGRSAPASSEPVRGERSSRSKAGAFAKNNLLERRKKQESELPVKS